MNDLIPFEYAGHQVRTIDLGSEPWFVAADVCAVLDIKDVSDAVSRVDPADRGQTLVRSGQQNRSMRVVNESGLYELIIRSDKPAARPFRRWITAEVLPAIRKTGSYVSNLTPRQMAELILAESDRADLAEAKVIELHPAADAWNTLADTGADYSCRDAAYILNRDPAIDTGQKRLFALLREWRLIGGDDRPYANHSAHVTLRPQTREGLDGGRIPAKPQVRVTVAGLQYLHKRLGGTSPLDFTAVAS